MFVKYLRKKWVSVTFVNLWLVSWQDDPLWYNEEERQLPFPYQCNSSLAHTLLLHGYWHEDFIPQRPLHIYFVSNWCPPFNLTAAAEVLIVITCNVSMNVCVWWMRSCARQCVYCCMYLVSKETDVKATDFSTSTGLHWSHSLKRTKLKKHIWKKLNTVEVGQVTKCIFVTSLFSGILEFYHSIRVALETAVLHQRFLFFASPACCRAPAAHSYATLLQVPWKMVIILIATNLHSAFTATFAHSWKCA